MQDLLGLPDGPPVISTRKGIGSSSFYHLDSMIWEVLKGSGHVSSLVLYAE